MHLFTRGFTLAELLTVVIIIALMSSFGVGYYRRSVAQARFNDNLAKAVRAVEKTNQDYFEYQMQGWGNLSSVTPGKASDSGYNYTIEVLPDFVPSGYSYPRGRVACVGHNAKGRAFCESMGYLDCGSAATSGKFYTTLSSGSIVCLQKGTNS